MLMLLLEWNQCSERFRHTPKNTQDKRMAIDDSYQHSQHSDLYSGDSIRLLRCNANGWHWPFERRPLSRSYLSLPDILHWVQDCNVPLPCRASSPAASCETRKGRRVLAWHWRTGMRGYSYRSLRFQGAFHRHINCGREMSDRCPAVRHPPIAYIRYSSQCIDGRSVCFLARPYMRVRGSSGIWLRATGLRTRTGVPSQGTILELLIWRSCYGACLVLLPTVANLVAMVKIHGREQSWLCFTICITDGEYLVVHGDIHIPSLH